MLSHQERRARCWHDFHVQTELIPGILSAHPRHLWCNHYSLQTVGDHWERSPHWMLQKWCSLWNKLLLLCLHEGHINDTSSGVDSKHAMRAEYFYKVFILMQLCDVWINRGNKVPGASQTSALELYLTVSSVPAGLWYRQSLVLHWDPPAAESHQLCAWLRGRKEPGGEWHFAYYVLTCQYVLCPS